MRKEITLTIGQVGELVSELLEDGNWYDPKQDVLITLEAKQ